LLFYDEGIGEIENITCNVILLLTWKIRQKEALTHKDHSQINVNLTKLSFT